MKWQAVDFEPLMFDKSFEHDRDAEYWKGEINAGRVLCYCVSDKRIDVKILVSFKGKSIVRLCHVQGKGIKHFIPEMAKMAKQGGFKAISFKAKKAGLIRLYEKYISITSLGEDEYKVFV